MSYYYGNSIIPSDAKFDAYYARRCCRCEAEFSNEDKQADDEVGDSMCVECREEMNEL